MGRRRRVVALLILRATMYCSCPARLVCSQWRSCDMVFEPRIALRTGRGCSGHLRPKGPNVFRAAGCLCVGVFLGTPVVSQGNFLTTLARASGRVAPPPRTCPSSVLPAPAPGGYGCAPRLGPRRRCRHFALAASPPLRTRSADAGRSCSRLGQLRPKLGQVWPMLAKLHHDLANSQLSGQLLDNFCAAFGHNWSTPGSPRVSFRDIRRAAFPRVT